MPEQHNIAIQKDATLYCMTCMCEQKMREGEFNHGKLPLFCTICGKQVSELIITDDGWQLHKCFYKSLVSVQSVEKEKEEKQ